MKVLMPTGRTVIDVYKEDTAAKVEATASDKLTAVAAVSNTKEGVCPKCGASMGFAIIPLGQVYYCGQCRVSTPMMEN